jgi:hypothetical protein
VQRNDWIRWPDRSWDTQRNWWLLRAFVLLVKLGELVLPMLRVLVTSDLARHEDIFLLVTQTEEKVYSTHLNFHA